MNLGWWVFITLTLMITYSLDIGPGRLFFRLAGPETKERSVMGLDSSKTSFRKTSNSAVISALRMGGRSEAPMQRGEEGGASFPNLRDAQTLPKRQEAKSIPKNNSQTACVGNPTLLVSHCPSVPGLTQSKSERRPPVSVGGVGSAWEISGGGGGTGHSAPVTVRADRCPHFHGILRIHLLHDTCI